MLQANIRGSIWLDIRNFRVIRDEDKFLKNNFNVEISDYLGSIKTSNDFNTPSTFTLATFQVNFNPDTELIDAICFCVYSEYDIKTSTYNKIDKIVYKLRTMPYNIDRSSIDGNLVIKEFDDEYQMLIDF